MLDYLQGNVIPLRKQIKSLNEIIEQLRVCKEFKVSHGARLVEENKVLRQQVEELKEYKWMYEDLCK